MIESMKVKSLYILALILAFLAESPARPLCAQSRPDLHLLPIPKSVALRDGRLAVDSSFSISLTGQKDPRISTAANRFLRRLQKKTGLPFSVSPISDARSAALEIHCNETGEQIQSAKADESYELGITPQGAHLAAQSPLGILRGLETLAQLVDLDDQSFFIPAILIRDEPRYRWRGILIDASRHWEPVEVIKRNLDAMATVKMNVLHWHLSDDQGFRVESRAFPKLHQLGSDGNYYAQSEVRDIVAYARDRGIRVIPEFDMPGHTTAILAAYPELASAPGPYQIERLWGVFPPCMDPSSKKVYAFLNTFIGEMADLFPDEYFHIGGDEVSGKQWDANPGIQAFKTRNKLKDNAALQAYFNRRLQKILARHGKKMIGWDEILHPDLPKTVMVQSWRGHSYLARSAHQGHTGILSHGYYLDAMRPASFLYAVDPMDKEVAALSDEEKTRILGAEACMWAEFVTPDNIESRIWPRTAAIAERLWSPPAINDVQDLYHRLEYASRELDSVGVRHQANPAEMLQRMAGDESRTQLQMLAQLLTPTSLSVRRKIQRYSSLMPLNRMVDAVLPESDAARRFAGLIDRTLGSQPGIPDALQPIRKQLAAWRDNAVAIRPTLEQSFLLKETIPVSETVADLCAKGLEALDHIETGVGPGEAWKEEAASLIARAEKPQAEMLIAIVAPVKKLLEIAAAIP
jgi:hexosaminidase